MTAEIAQQSAREEEHAMRERERAMRAEFDRLQAEVSKSACLFCFPCDVQIMTTACPESAKAQDNHRIKRIAHFLHADGHPL